MAYYHGWATVPRRERATTCPHKKTSHALGYGSFRLGTHDARTSCIPLKWSQVAMLLRGIGVTHTGVSREPQSSVTLVTEMADQKSLHWACNRHISMAGLFSTAGLVEPAPPPVSVTAGFIPCHSGIT